MTEPTPDRQASRMEHLAPGVPVEAKIALLLGLAGGLFAAIVLSYAEPDLQYVGLGVGICAGLLCALIMIVRGKRINHVDD